MPEQKNIAVIGLDDFHRDLLETVRGAGNYRFFGIIPYRQIVNPEHYAIEDLLHTARRELAEIEGGVDAIIGHWDFPTTSLLPLLQAEHGLPGPGLEAVLACENKYATRLAEAEATPELTPPFALVNPRDDGVLDDPPLPYPWSRSPAPLVSGSITARISITRWNASGPASPSLRNPSIRCCSRRGSATSAPCMPAATASPRA
jgi:hypothetical protein